MTSPKSAEVIALSLTPCWQVGVENCQCPMHIMRPSIVKALTEYAEARAKEGFLYQAMCRDVRNESLEEAAKVADENKFVPGQTSVKIDVRCLKEFVGQPEVGLRKIHNAALDAVSIEIRALKASNAVNPESKPWNHQDTNDSLKDMEEK